MKKKQRKCHAMRFPSTCDTAMLGHIIADQGPTLGISVLEK